MRRMKSNLFGVVCPVLVTMFFSSALTNSALAKDVFKPEDVFKLKYATTAEISPDGKWIACTVSVQRQETDKVGGRYSELHVVATETGASRPFITGKVNVSSSRWSPDGKKIAFLTRRGENASTQVWSIKGCAVFLPNYRASTGYGLEHIKLHLGDPAGVEFDDIADGIDHLVNIGLADPDRVGLGGGSYGGFAAAWFSSYYTEKVEAVVMFVGISDIISKLGTTDIPYEMLFVHYGKQIEEIWQLSLERSPIYHAHKSRTATLIIGAAQRIPGSIPPRAWSTTGGSK